MFNKMLSIYTSIYWFKHCNVSRSTSFMKAILLTSQSTTALTWMTIMPLQMSFQSHARKFHVRHSILAVFFFVRHGHKASWEFLAAYFWFCWLLVSFPLHHLFSIALSSHGLGKSGLVYMLFVYQWACTLVCSHFCVCPFSSMPKVICDSWCLHFIMMCLWSGPPGFNCWTSVAPAFQNWFAFE